MPLDANISNHTVYSEVECSLRCLQQSTCVGFNYRPKSSNYAINCQLSSKAQEKKDAENGEWTFFQKVSTADNGLIKSSNFIGSRLAQRSDVFLCFSKYEKLDMKFEIRDVKD